MGGRREVSIISQRPVNSSDLKHERVLFRECLNIFATGCSDFKSNFFPHTPRPTKRLHMREWFITSNTTIDPIK